MSHQGRPGRLLSLHTRYMCTHKAHVYWPVAHFLTVGLSGKHLKVTSATRCPVVTPLKQSSPELGPSNGGLWVQAAGPGPSGQPKDELVTTHCTPAAGAVPPKVGPWHAGTEHALTRDHE